MSDTPTERICVNCKHCVINTEDKARSLCRKDPSEEFSRLALIIGVQAAEHSGGRRFGYCTTMRIHASDSCSTEGRWFEPKEQEVAHGS
jgi:hypothetical protein